MAGAISSSSSLLLLLLNSLVGMCRMWGVLEMFRSVCNSEIAVIVGIASLNRIRVRVSVCVYFVRVRNLFLKKVLC